MRKPKDWGQPCPNPDCTHYRLMHRGNIRAIATYLTQTGKPGRPQPPLQEPHPDVV
jgi:hypothetical protein